MQKNEVLTETSVSPLARGKRVEILRRITGLSRRLFSEKYGVPSSSLQNWEDARRGGLSDKGARKLINLLKPEGIVCSYEWLMFGVGASPQIFNVEITHAVDLAKNQAQTASDHEQEQILAKELLLFHQHNPQAMDYLVMDDAMEPRFIKGECVAGCRHHGNAIAKLIGLDCIIQTSTGDVVLRTIKKKELNNHYTLSCLNPNTTVEKPILYDVEILIAAPVIWARRK